MIMLVIFVVNAMQKFYVDENSSFLKNKCFLTVLQSNMREKGLFVRSVNLFMHSFLSRALLLTWFIDVNMLKLIIV